MLLTKIALVRNVRYNSTMTPGVSYQLRCFEVESNPINKDLIDQPTRTTITIAKSIFTHDT